VIIRARIIGLGQAAAGDDGVGLAVVEWLQQHGVPEGVELLRAAEGSALIALLETPAAVVLVDAVLSSPPGEIRELTPEQLATAGLLPLSTHAMGVPQALELAQVLAPDTVSPSIRIVAVTISRPQRYEQQLSRAVAAAVPRAAERVLALVGG
jgi:hydrogenase maturation protease